MHSQSTTRRETFVSQDTPQSDRRFRLDVDRLTMIPAAAINQAAEPAPQRVGPLALIARAVATLALWRDRAYSRRALATFDRHLLRDIGVSPYDAGREMNKPFWRE